MKKRILAFLLVLVMVLSLLPTGVVAEEQTAPEAHSDAHDCTGCDGTVTWTAWDKKNEFPTTPGHYYLTVNVDLTGWRTIGSGEYTICLNGHYIKGEPGKSFATVGDGTVLTISDCTAYYDADGKYTSGYVSGSQSGNGGCFYVSCGGTLNLESGAIKDSNSTSSSKLGGGAVYLQGSNATKKAVFNMTGGEIFGCSAAKNGGAVYVSNGVESPVSEFNMSGGRIHNNTASKGGAIYCVTAKVTISGDAVIEDHTISSDMGAIGIYDGVLEMSGGTIRNNQAANGAGVLVQSGGSMTMTGGDICGNTATNGGGGIYISTGCEFTMEGGTVSGNNAVSGGGIYHNGSIATHSGGTIKDNTASTTGGGVNITGGAQVSFDNTTITKNHAQKAGGIYGSTNSKITLSGGAVTENTADTVGGGIYVNEKNISLTVAGDPVVTGNTAGGTNSNLHLEGTRIITLGALTEGAAINVTIDGESRAISNESTTDCSAYFDGDNEYRMVSYHDDGKLWLEVSDEHQHCLCDAAMEGCSHEKQVWIPWESGASLPSTSGNYYLTKDVTLSEALELAGDQDIKICLHGKNITVDCAFNDSRDRLIGLKENAKFTVTDCSATVDSEGNYKAGTLSGGSFSGIILRKESVKAQFNMYGGILTGNKAATAGGAVCVQGTGTFNLYGGEISGNEAVEHGGAFYVDKGSLNVYGGSITNNTAGGNGGGIYAKNQAKLTISGGEISKNTAADGGAVAASNTELTMTGGKISENTANSGGGVILTSGAQLKLSGGIIEKNTAAANGGGIFVSKESGITMTGGQVSDNRAVSGAGIYHLTATGNYAGGIISGNVAETSGGALYLNNTKLTLSDDLRIEKNQAKDGGGVIVSSGSQLELSGGIIKENTATANGGGIFVSKESEITMTGGQVSDNRAVSGAGIYHLSSTGSYTGGTISGNVAEGSGGALYLNNTKLTLSDDLRIEKNQAKDGGGIFVGTAADLILSGGMICGNEATGFGGGMYTSNKMKLLTIQGNPVVTDNKAAGKTSNLHLGGSQCFALGKMTQGAKIGITVDSDMRAISSVYEQDYAAYFTADNGNQITYKDDNKLYLELKADHDHCLCGAAMAGCDHQTNSWYRWEETTKLPNKSGNYYLTADVTLSAALELTGETDIRICLNGHNITVNAKEGTSADRIFGLSEKARLTITDCTAKTADGKYTAGKLTGGSLSGVIIRKEATGVVFNMYGGILTENKAAVAGGAVCVQGVSTFNLYGGEISGNEAVEHGGAFYVDGATLNVYGGSIHGNTAKANGGGIYAKNGAKVTVAGGEISENKAADGGGLAMAAKAELTVSGGQIKKNTASSGGGVILTGGAGLTMTGGEISGNAAKLNGGAVYVSKNTTVTMSGGKVSGNTTEESGAAFYLSYATITLSGGEITGNRAKKAGAAVYLSKSTGNLSGTYIGGNKAQNAAGIMVSTSSHLNMSGGTIADGTVEDRGSGVYHNKSTGTYTGGTISGNKAGIEGAGIYATGSTLTLSGVNLKNNQSPNSAGLGLSTKCDVTMTAGQISGNSGENGAGVLIASKSNFKMTGGKISNNTVTNSGGGIYLSKNAFMTITGGEISDNTACGFGGGIYTYSPCTIGGALIANNKVIGSEEQPNPRGGGVFIGSQTNKAHIHDCQFIGNHSYKDGGGLYGQNMNFITVENVKFENNIADNKGGGMYINLGCYSTMRDITLIGNSSTSTGSGMWAADDLSIHNLVATGNTSTGTGGAVYITTAGYDGESYVTNLVKISGLVQVYDNVGNAPDFVLSEGAFATIGSEGLAEGSRINVILRAGLLTQTLFGNYDYEGGNLLYTVTPGTRSATDPEKLPDSTEPQPEQTEPTEQATTDATTPIGGADGPTAILVSGSSIVLWSAIAIVVAAAAVVIPIVIKKKKN